MWRISSFCFFGMALFRLFACRAIFRLFAWGLFVFSSFCLASFRREKTPGKKINTRHAKRRKVFSRQKDAMTAWSKRCHAKRRNKARRNLTKRRQAKSIKDATQKDDKNSSFKWRLFAWRIFVFRAVISSFHVVDFVFSSFHMVLFRVFVVFFAWRFSSFRMASYFLSFRLFAWHLFAAKIRNRRNGTIQPHSENFSA